MTTESHSPEKTKSWTHWFEIPVTDYDRAKSFYEQIFDTSIYTEDFGPFRMGIFPHKDVGCALCRGDGYEPSNTGTLVYMDASPDLNEALNRIEEAGGKVIHDKKQISEDHGFMAVFVDTEGNRLALHSMN